MWDNVLHISVENNISERFAGELHSYTYSSLSYARNRTVDLATYSLVATSIKKDFSDFKT